MPSKNLENIQQGEVAAKKALAALSTDVDVKEKRAAAKKVRRAQRNRRKMVVQADKQKPKSSTEAAE
jgi:hypothetical protein